MSAAHRRLAWRTSAPYGDAGAGLIIDLSACLNDGSASSMASRTSRPAIYLLRGATREPRRRGSAGA